VGRQELQVFDVICDDGGVASTELVGGSRDVGETLMEMYLNRDAFSEKSTQGVLTIPQPIISLTLQTLELPKKDGLPGSCIPAGRYQVTLYDSPHFGRVMPLITGIPERSEIEIHPGNFPDNTRGCVLVGETRTVDAIENSVQAFDQLFPLIEAAVKGEGCWINITETVVGNVGE
jgi:uncharacterized protein DUF5675